MNANTQLLNASVSSVKTAASADYTFYFTLAILSAVAVFLGFSRSYYLKGVFHGPGLPILFHVHGLVFSTWVLFFVLQTWLIKDGRPKIHRQMGYAGAVLVTLMVVLGVAITFVSTRMGHFNKIPGARDPAEACLFSLFDISLFGLFVWAGFFWRHDPQVHQRLMVFSMVVPLLPSAIGRMCNFHPAIATPIIFAFILAGPIYDLITRRRMHWAYVAGLVIVFLTSPPLRILLGRTHTWHALFQRAIS